MSVFGNQVEEIGAAHFDAFWGLQYNVVEDGIITTITAYFTLNGDSCYLAVYDDTGADYPGSLIVSTAEFTPAGTGWQTIDVADTHFNAGKLWIVAALKTSTVKIKYHASRDQALLTKYKTTAYGAPPASFPAGGSSQNVDASIYVNYTPDATGFAGKLMVNL